MKSASEKPLCEYNEFRRPRYFHGMLLDDKAFRSEQNYHAGKRKLLNRMLHGSGVVCGLGLNWAKDGQWIEIESGLALDCYGNEIWLEEPWRIEVKKLLPKGLPKSGQPCLPKGEQPTDEPRTFYLGLRYHEIGTDPESVYLPGGGCEQTTCEYSKDKEGYCAALVDCYQEKAEPGLLKRFCECMRTETTPQGAELIRDRERAREAAEQGSGEEVTKKEGGCWKCHELQDPQRCQCKPLEDFCESSVPCPDCSMCHDHPYVILGQIEVDEKCRVQNVCINECRTYILSGRMIQHLLVSVFEGVQDIVNVDVEGRTDIEIPDIKTLAGNPIHALCWYLRYFVVENGAFVVKKGKDQCGALIGKPAGDIDRLGKLEKDLASLHARVDELRAAREQNRPPS